MFSSIDKSVISFSKPNFVLKVVKNVQNLVLFEGSKTFELFGSKPKEFLMRRLSS